MPRWEGDRGYVELPHDHAVHLLEHEAWRNDLRASEDGYGRLTLSVTVTPS